MLNQIILVFVFMEAVIMNAEDRLFQNLFIENHYDPKVRPVLDTKDPVTINFRYDLVHLFEVNERSQTVCILSQIYQYWYDHRLYWNSSEYNDMIDLTVPNNLIWTPDTSLLTTADLYRPNTEDLQKAIITLDPNMSAGMISYYYNTKHTIGCQFDMQYFPFDTQNCTFEFGSWSHDVRKVNYTLASDEVTMELFKSNNAWKIVSFRMVEKMFYYNGCPYTYSTIHAHLVIKRRPLYYIFNLVIPTIVINILSSFSLFASPGSPENLHDKLQIGITALLSYCILLLSVSDQTPKGSTSVPLLGIFYIVIMIQNAMELFASICLCCPKRRSRITKLFSRKPKKGPKMSKVTPVKQSGCVYQGQPTGTQDNNPIMSQTDRDCGMKPEIICLVISLASTFFIAFVLFVIGFMVMK